MYRQLSAGCIALGLLVLLTAALVGTASANSSLKVWVQGNDVLMPEFETVLNGFKEIHPDIDVELSAIAGSQAEFTDKLAVAIASGSGPDLTWMEGSTVRKIAAQGLLLDVTRPLSGIKFAPAESQEMMLRGKMWAAPYHATIRGLFKRTDFLQQAGIDPNSNPADLQELEAWSHKLTIDKSDGSFDRVGFVPWGNNFGPPGWIWTFDGHMVDETFMKPTANIPKNVKAFEWLRSYGLRFGGNMGVIRAGQGGFVDGSVAMMIGSTSNLGRILKEGTPITTGPIPHPADGANGTWAGGHAIAIPYNAVNKEDAVVLLQYFAGEKAQLDRFEASGVLLPANWDALTKVVAELPEQYGPMFAQLPEANPRTPLWVEYYVRQLLPARDAVVKGEKTPQQALDEVQQVMVERFKEVFK